MACDGVIGPAVSVSEAVASDSDVSATAAEAAEAGGVTVLLSAGEGGVVTEVGGEGAAGALGGTEILGADATRVGAPGGGLRTTRARCGGMGSTPAGGVKTIRPELGLELGIKRRGSVFMGSRSSRIPKFTNTPSTFCAKDSELFVAAATTSVGAIRIANIFVLTLLAVCVVPRFVAMPPFHLKKRVPDWMLEHPLW